MTIRHVAVFTFDADFSPEERSHWVGLVQALPERIPEVRRLSVGQDIRGGAHAYEVAIVADFEDLDALDAYSRHPAHDEVTRISGPVRRRFATVDFVVPEQG